MTSFDTVLHQTILNSDRSNAPSGQHDRFLRQFLVDRQGLVQAALVRWLDGCFVFDQGQERSLRSGSIHLEYNSLPHPDWDPLHHSTNKDRKKVLIGSGVSRRLG